MIGKTGSLVDDFVFSPPITDEKTKSNEEGLPGGRQARWSIRRNTCARCPT